MWRVRILGRRLRLAWRESPWLEAVGMALLILASAYACLFLLLGGF
jgi:hypothetical protein